MPDIENSWIKQQDYRYIKIQDTQQEWDLVQLYVAEMKKVNPSFIDKPSKISRKILKKFLLEHIDDPRIVNSSVSEEDINHSFFIYPEATDKSKYQIGALARSKPYIYNGKIITEGILGAGTQGRFNPCRMKLNTECTENNLGTIIGIKTLIETNFTADPNNPELISQHISEVNILRKLGKGELVVRDRAAEFWYKASDANTKWILGNPIGQFKTYIFGGIAPGETLSLLDTHNLTRLQKLKLSLSIIQAVGFLHDRNIVHRDLHLANFTVMTDPLQKKYFFVTAIDFSRAIDISNKMPSDADKIKLKDISSLINLLRDNFSIDLATDYLDLSINDLKSVVEKEIELIDALNLESQSDTSHDYNLNLQIITTGQLPYNFGIRHGADHRDINLSFESPCELSPDKLSYLTSLLRGNPKLLSHEEILTGIKYTFKAKALGMQKKDQLKDIFISACHSQIKLQRFENATVNQNLSEEKPVKPSMI